MKSPNRHLLAVRFRRQMQNLPNTIVSDEIKHSFVTEYHLLEWRIVIKNGTDMIAIKHAYPCYQMWEALPTTTKCSWTPVPMVFDIGQVTQSTSTLSLPLGQLKAGHGRCCHLKTHNTQLYMVTLFLLVQTLLLTALFLTVIPFLANLKTNDGRRTLSIVTTRRCLHEASLLT